jgi:hypothetical protein
LIIAVASSGYASTDGKPPLPPPDRNAGEAARDSGAKGIALPRCVLGSGHPGLPDDSFRPPGRAFVKERTVVGESRPGHGETPNAGSVRAPTRRRVYEASSEA